jgi:hypothetical protein
LLHLEAPSLIFPLPSTSISTSSSVTFTLQHAISLASTGLPLLNTLDLFTQLKAFERFNF